MAFWCGEDPLAGAQAPLRRCLLHYKVAEADVGDRFFLNSGHEDPLRLAIEKPRGLFIDTELRDAIVAAIRRDRIDVAIFDPLITMHLVNENSNVSINALADLLKDIAHDTGCAVYLLHHLRKANGAQGDFTADDARGAKALVDAARSVRVLNVMTVEEADRVGIPANERTRHFRVDDGKANMARPPELAVWRKLESVDLGNGGFGLAGDNVQVAVAWRLPGLFDKVTEAHLCEVQRQMGDGEFAAATQTENWLGWLVGRVTGLETQTKGGRAHVRQVIEVWVKAGVDRGRRRLGTQRAGECRRSTAAAAGTGEVRSRENHTAPDCADCAHSGHPSMAQCAVSPGPLRGPRRGETAQLRTPSMVARTAAQTDCAGVRKRGT